MPRDRLLLGEMIEAAGRIVALVGRLDPERPAADRDLLDALLWNFTVLGEGSGQVSAELKADHPEVAWADPVRLRNRIVHGYWSVDLDVLVSTARDDVPRLVAELRVIEGEI
ncbi:MAG: DUF86 domain-containing protein [Acidimicrobiia bacterium]|nr:DUF86 domain-containing protein [Acidimicrobiia bacterium]